MVELHKKGDEDILEIEQEEPVVDEDAEMSLEGQEEEVN